MKHFFSVILVLTASLALAQGKWYVAPTGGFQFSSAYIEHTVYSVNMITKAIPGAHGGVMINHFAPYRSHRSLNTGLRFGAMYAQKGWRQDYLTVDSLISNVTTHMNYLTIPVESIIYGGSEKTKVYAILGLFLDFLINYEVPEEPDDMNSINHFWTYDPDRDRSFGYGLKGALGIQRSLGPGDLTLEGFFGYALSNFIYTTNRAETVPDISNHWAAGATVSYLIPLGK